MFWPEPYIRCTYGVFGREISKCAVYIYGSGQPYICCSTLTSKVMDVVFRASKLKLAEWRR